MGGVRAFSNVRSVRSQAERSSRREGHEGAARGWGRRSALGDRVNGLPALLVE